MTITISELRIHPVKGFKRILLETMEITTTGPLHDRQFMLIDDDNRFISQRTHPAMATISVIPDQEGFCLKVPGYDSITFIEKSPQSPPIDAVIWKDTVKVVEVSPQASDILSDYLKIPCRLVTMAPHHNRLVSSKYARLGTELVQFADGFPFLLISQASLDDLNSRLDVPVSMDRFRPNIVVTGCIPYEEDSWESIKIGDIIFDLPKLCGRCTVTTVNQDTGVIEKERGRNPLKTLATYRNTEMGIIFGKNMTHRTLGQLKLGQTVEVLKTC